MYNSELQSVAHHLSALLGKDLVTRQWLVATAESCTGGGVSSVITAVPGSSKWFEYGVVAYANKAKQHLLGVSADSLNTSGAVSEPVVLQMIDGVLALSGAQVAVAISGIAGPDGGTVDKPVGTVWFAWGLASGERKTSCCHFDGERIEVQSNAVIEALRGLLAIINES